MDDKHTSDLGATTSTVKPLAPIGSFSPPAEIGARSSLKNVPILIVEDDPAAADVLSIVLAAQGCEVRIARSAEEALVILKSFHPAAIVLDLILPKMSGPLFAQTIKQNPATKDIVILAATVANGPDAERIVLEAGCAAYFKKPLDTHSFPGQLLAHLQVAK